MHTTKQNTLTSCQEALETMDKTEEGKEQNLNKVIRKFYYPVHSILSGNTSNSFQQKLYEEARTVFLQDKSSDLLDHNELKSIWMLLDRYQIPGVSADEQLINYADFRSVGKMAGEKYAPYFTAKVYARLRRSDPLGKIAILDLFNYIMRKVWLKQTRIGLSLYDATGQGYLRESDMENYVEELIPTLAQLEGLEQSFQPFYVCTTVRKFFFFLDPLRTGKIKIQEILSSGFLDDLLELRDEDLPKDNQIQNWFSASSALKVYGQYLNLDKDHNGMLSKQELLKYGMGTLNQIFIDRVFQECLTYSGEMDYKTYLDFVLALDNKRTPQALQYFFRILDVDHKGYLNVFDLNYFYKGIRNQMIEHNQEPVNFDDVCDETFDMVHPKDPTRITYDDLLNCGHGETVVSILIDLNGFWTYENREALVVASEKQPSF
ncbi:serine/threonine-protein phosphatase 2A regulatory subunit B'' subunit gamma-like isoform X3 [Artemia franciscana]|uniref:serine/threonine-protein phosphatase 2A regulatory subunit B'' subunit gamma-like isoform X3 n=1 Tax=Artemia franciscana TaxID=6661 RepID=UPI0032DB38A3